MRYQPDSERQVHSLELEDKLRSKLKELLPFASYVTHFKRTGSASPHVRMQRELNTEITQLYKMIFAPKVEPPEQGISLRSLQALSVFLAQFKGYTKMSTAEVWLNILQPLTIAHGCSIVDLVNGQDADAKRFLRVTPHDVGKANIFVSHAWNGSFHELIMSLSRVERDKGYSDVKKKYYWIDVFSNNQYREMHFRSTFSNVIANIKRTVLVLHPWNNPVILSRCWCLWEIYCSIQADATIEFVLSKREEASLRQTFRDALSSERDPRQMTFAPNTKWYPQLDLENATASEAEDERFIKTRIESLEGGYQRIERMVVSVLKNLYAREVIFTVMAIRSNRRASVNAAFFLRSMNRLEGDSFDYDEDTPFLVLAKSSEKLILALHKKMKEMRRMRRSTHRYRQQQFKLL